MVRKLPSFQSQDVIIDSLGLKVGVVRQSTQEIIYFSSFFRTTETKRSQKKRF